MTSATQSTATVETLTAEVRVLQVGNRQITMSVAKQLDVVDFMRIEAFGRVAISRRDEPCVVVIGRDSDSGALVCADVPPPRLATPDVSVDVVGNPHRPPRRALFNRHGFKFVAAARFVDEESFRPEPGEIWGANHDALSAIDDAIFAAEHENRVIRRLRALPLIVLAGLR